MGQGDRRPRRQAGRGVWWGVTVHDIGFVSRGVDLAIGASFGPRRGRTPTPVLPGLP